MRCFRNGITSLGIDINYGQMSQRVHEAHCAQHRVPSKYVELFCVKKKNKQEKGIRSETRADAHSRGISFPTIMSRVARAWIVCGFERTVLFVMREITSAIRSARPFFSRMRLIDWKPPQYRPFFDLWLSLTPLKKPGNKSFEADVTLREPPLGARYYFVT